MVEMADCVEHVHLAAGVPEQEPSAPSMVTGVAEAAGKVVAAVTEPIKAAAAAIAQPMAAKQNGPTPAESSAQPATKPEIGRSSPFAQGQPLPQLEGSRQCCWLAF